MSISVLDSPLVTLLAYLTFFLFLLLLPYISLVSRYLFL